MNGRHNGHETSDFPYGATQKRTGRDERQRITKPLTLLPLASPILGPKLAPEPNVFACSSSYGFGTTSGTQAGH
jgi:hypothetical protein